MSEDLVVNPSNKGIQWVAVFLNAPPKIHPDWEKPSGEVELGQEFCMFKPHLLMMRQGQKLIVSSSDPIGHNTNISGFKNSGWNELLPAADGGNKSTKEPPPFVAENKAMPIKCNVHSWMQSFLFVLPHPYYAVTDENGAFEIKNVPAGTVKLVVWQEKIGWGEGKAQGKEIEVKAGETTDLGNIVLKLP